MLKGGGGKKDLLLEKKSIYCLPSLGWEKYFYQGLTYGEERVYWRRSLEKIAPPSTNKH